MKVAASERIEEEEDRGEAEAFAQATRIVEALLFASAAPLSEEELARSVPAGISTLQVLTLLSEIYAARGVNLRQVAGKWAFRTAPDLSYLLAAEAEPPRKLSRAALEVLAIIAYHQPVTRAEIEEIRGVATAKGTLDILLEAGWVRLRGRRRSPGRPVTYGTTPGFLDHFGLDRIDDLPGLDELKGSGFIEGRLSKDLTVPLPDDAPDLRDDEDPLGDLFTPLDDGEGGPHTADE
ncbi:SMC-Scp complex subunit ScpB [Bosea caraganae]|uniref:SMC-Scp complex subunit ScpB n=1 Tax=Bosea caraganae TaxID=2763117 RepID=A0A370LCE3_9HYPH|nr:SMC-Scp complex subunit ScpB [Bosea caraganae]RDJ27628.1 SMC-Scp complex subunit ScpB [Bosea caraganae]RDJ29642.1 SMC-Scp complex subunit ScpB [Bosea caraganae]